MISGKLEFTKEHEKALARLQPKELTKLLRQTGKKLVEREKIFVDHLAQGQANWEENQSRYAAYKARRYGSSRKFVKSGAAAASLSRVSSTMRLRASGKRRWMRISLRKMDGKTNVYAVAQRGRFGGVKQKNSAGFGRTLTAGQVQVENSRARAEYGRAKAAGTFRGSFVRYQKRLAKRRGISTSRVSVKAMPITQNLPGDDRIASEVFQEELNITMEKRGF